VVGAICIKIEMEWVLNGRKIGIRAFMDDCVKNTNDDCVATLARTAALQ